MHHLNLFNIFSTTRAERQPLKKVIVSSVNNLNNEVKGNIQTNEKFTQVHRILYFELCECLQILKDAKKDYVSFRNLEQTQRNLVTALNIIFYLAAPGGTLTLMIKMHQYLNYQFQQTLKNFMPSLNNATAIRNVLSNEYQKEENKYNNMHSFCGFSDMGKKFESFMHIFEYFCDGDYRDIPLERHRDGQYRNVCALPTNYPLPLEECNKAIKDFCIEESNYFKCIDNFDNTRDQALTKLKATYDPQISSLNQQISDLQNTIDSSYVRSWDVGTIIAFTLTTGAGVALLVYLYKSWRQAYNEYQEDLQQSHDLNECLAEKHLPRIRNLADKLKIALNNKTIEDLTIQLETIKETHHRKESIISFSLVANRHIMPKDITQKILVEADLLQTPKPG